MKIHVYERPDVQEVQVDITCKKHTEEITQIITALTSMKLTLPAYLEGNVYSVDVSSIYYFESIDGKTFMYTHDKIYKSKLRLYEAEERYSSLGFVRISKSMVCCLYKAERIQPEFGKRLRITLENQEQVIVSRQYVPGLRKKLHLP